MGDLLNTIFKYGAVVLDWVQKGLFMLLRFRRPIKGNIEGEKKVYYTVDHAQYSQVEVSLLKGEKYFLTEKAAVNDGWTKAV